MKYFFQFQKKRQGLFCIFIICLLFNSVGSVYASFTIEDEIKLGKEFYDKLNKSNFIIHDQKVDTYITQVGNKILAQSQKAPFDFRFSVINSSAINAFATPGGYVYLNKGLIELVEKESELAAVLAHEIGHVNARHIASTIEKSQKIGIATLAAILAGAFLGGGGEATAAVTAFSLATATSLNLKYSRENEEEADRLGISYLVNAGYDPAAMLNFLKIMRRYEFYSSAIPSYFLTHPGTNERISYLDSLLQTSYTHKGEDSIVGNLKRIQIVLTFKGKNLDSSLKYFQNEFKKNPNDVDVLYGLASMQDKLGQTVESEKNFLRALSLSPNDQEITRDLGIVYYKLGRTTEAINMLKKALTLNENDLDTMVYLGRSYELQGEYINALDLYKKLEKKKIDDADVYYNIAMAYGKANNSGESHYNFGIYFKKKNKMESSLFHFKEALKYFSKYSEKYEEIEKEIKSFENREKSKNSLSHDSKRRGTPY
ncbi:MAG: M48 family metalloprotease [Syntrophaceae bacterium]